MVWWHFQAEGHIHHHDDGGSIPQYTLKVKSFWQCFIPNLKNWAFTLQRLVNFDLRIKMQVLHILQLMLL